MTKEIRPKGKESGDFDRLMVKPSRWRGVRLKLVGTYFLVSAATVVLVLAIEVFGIPGTGFSGSIEIRTEEARRHLDQLADTTIGQIRLRLEEKRYQGAVLAGNDLVRNRVERLLGEIREVCGTDEVAGCWRERPLAQDYSDLLSLFRSMVEDPEGPRSVWVVDARSGRVVLATDSADLGLDVSERSFIHDILTTESPGRTGVCKSGIYRGLINIVVVYVIGGSRDPSCEALLVVHFEPNRVLTPALTAVRSLGPSTEAFVVDCDGILLTSLEHLMADGSYPQPLFFHMEDRASTLAAEGREGLIRSMDYRGREVLAAFRSVGVNWDHRWGLVVKRDLADVLAPLREAARNAILAGLAALVVLGAVVVVVARSFIRPILTVARAAYRIGGGDLDARTSVTTSDEIGALAVTFNAMAARIQEAHTDLEQRVEERTARLSNAMAALESEIRERRRVEISLRESEALYRAVTEKLPVMLCRLLPGGEITFVNELYRRYFQREGIELVGRKIGSLEEEDGMEIFLEHFNKLTPDRSTEDHEHQANTVRDGSRWIQWSNRALFDTNGEIVSILSVGADITERKEAEEEVRRLSQSLEQRVKERTAELTGRVEEVEGLNRAMLNLADDIGTANANLQKAVQQLEDANQELESFAYSVSHDLRAPLRHIAGFVEILEETASETLDVTGRRYLRLVAEAAGRMGRLIDDLLAFSRTRRLELNPTEIDLDALVSDVVREVQERAGDREIVWGIEPLPEVLADRTTLRMALVNLIDNAVKYTGTVDRATIEVGAGQAEDGEEVIWVKDNGVGFDPKYGHKLFGVFQRLHRAEEFEGTGIGLANVRRIIARHGGRTWAEGEVGKGATFFFSLPRKEG